MLNSECILTIVSIKTDYLGIMGSVAGGEAMLLGNKCSAKRIVISVWSKVVYLFLFLTNQSVANNQLLPLARKNS
ncbi:hypothetical protein [Carnobacterium gallinarum]|uniref:hypothetical protein n=1 Tax=Carnobacterium gallinarum TaxID=2749 RepID=UPI0005556D5F|nr:hypothetical protein [Carnobacterium gallinarum]